MKIEQKIKEIPELKIGDGILKKRFEMSNILEVIIKKALNITIRW